LTDRNASAFEAFGFEESEKTDRLPNFVEDRYSSWDGELGEKIEEGRLNLADLEKIALEIGGAHTYTSGKQVGNTKFL
jgi:xylose isomerase